MTVLLGVAFLAVGLCAGVASGLFGLGGGIVIVPLLMFGLGFTQLSANGTSLVAMLLPVGLLGAITYFRSGAITPFHVGAGLLIALGLFIGILFGAKIAVGLSAPLLKKLFALLLLVVAVRLWFGR